MIAQILYMYMCSSFNNWNRLNGFLFLIFACSLSLYLSLSICLVRCTTSFLSQKRIYANMFIRLKTVPMPSHAVLSKHFMLRNRTIINWIIICIYINPSFQIHPSYVFEMRKWIDMADFQVLTNSLIFV